MLYIHDSLKSEKILFDIVKDYKIVKKLPEEGIIAIKRKNEFITPYKYGPDIVDREQFVLRLSIACPARCEYCYIKSFYNNQPVFFFNIGDIERELSIIEKNHKFPYINCGENSDSFAFDNIAKQSLIVYHLAKKFPYVTFEMRSKIPTHINREFLNLKPLKNIIISCSLNPIEIIKNFEHNTDDLVNRINMLKGFKDVGYKIGLRIDPIIYNQNFKNNYANLCEIINKNFKENEITDIQLGCLRITKRQYNNLKKKKNSPIFLCEEILLSWDKKWRYFIGIRIKIYKFIIKKLFKFKDKISLSNENQKIIDRSIHSI